jgi:hypothetical protein
MARGQDEALNERGWRCCGSTREQLRAVQRAWRFSRWQVDNELEVGRELNGHVSRFFAIEDAAGIDAGPAQRVRKVQSVAHPAADFGKSTEVWRRAVADRSCQERAFV